MAFIRQALPAPAPAVGGTGSQQEVAAGDAPGAVGLRWADVALVVVVFGAGLRLWRWASGLPLWLDEQMIAGNLRGRGFAELTGRLDDSQSAPLGWLWAQRAVVEVIGTGERALRAVPVLFGIATLLAAWLIARRWLGPVGAVTLVGFCAVNGALLSYSTQVKHYSADTFCTLALLGLAGWVAEAPQSARRIAVWWAAAVAGSWLSLGAVLVTPGLALVLLGAVWWRGRWVAALRGAVLGLVWLASFAAHYLLALRHATGSSYLRSFWAGLGYPPEAAGPGATAEWFMRRLWLLADDPLRVVPGTTPGLLANAAVTLFWLAVLAGMVVAARRRLAFGLLLAVPLLSAFLLAAVRVVPLVGRLALWVVPSLFVAAACALDAAGRVAQRVAGRVAHRHVARARVRAAAVGLSAAAGLLALALLVPPGVKAVSSTASVPDVDDRASVAWMRSQHQPGDVTLVVGTAGRALQWYDPARTLKPSHTVVPGALAGRCDPAELRRLVARYHRVIAYAGDRLYPYRTTYLLLERQLATLGQIVQVRHFGAGHSTVYVVDLRLPPVSAPSPADGCLAVR
ncbi:MAG TPA: hypothetical protein VFM54_02130 [Micromonosporaceae bacterium]|nr:hypothetical protein [Micromonosporaceae bacterium]